MAPINVNKQILSKAHIQNSYTYSEKERSSGEKSLKLVSLHSSSNKYYLGCLYVTHYSK